MVVKISPRAGALRTLGLAGSCVDIRRLHRRRLQRLPGGTTAFAASEPPPNPLSSREIWTTLVSGVSSIVRILYRLQLVLVTFSLSKVTSSFSASLRPLTTPLFMQRSSCRGLMTLPGSTPIVNLVTWSVPVEGVTTTSAMPTQYGFWRTTIGAFSKRSISLAYGGSFYFLPALEGFEFIEGARPVGA